MSIKLSEEQIAYVNLLGKIVLNACPGSGKTTTIAHKLYSLIKHWNNNHFSILCLSFTNVAKNEIADKFREINGFSLHHPHLISTIDSFINTYITLPFAHKIKNIDKRYRIIDDVNYLDKIFQSDWQLIKTYKNYLFTFQPSKIDFTVNNGYSWDGHNKTESEFIQYAKTIKTKQIAMGLLKTTDSAFFAFIILKRFPRIAKYLGKKYSYLIIDEAQDTSEIQHSIIELLYNGGLKNIDLVGDPYQCLYQWRDASPELFLQKFDDKENWKGINLNENRRSTKKIIDTFSLLRRSSDKNIIPVINNDTDLSLHIIKYDSSNYTEAINKYERLCIENNFNSCSILVRGNSLKNSLLGKENEYYPWDKSSIAYQIVSSKIYISLNQTKEAVKIIRKIIINLKYPDISFDEVKNKEEEFKNDKGIYSLIFKLLRELPPFDLSIINWTIQTQQYLKIILGLKNEPNFKIRKKNVTKGKNPFDKKTLNNPMNIYFKKPITDNNSLITTIHQVKGMTFDSVFLILSNDSLGQNISLKDLELKNDSIPTEKQRLIYVALSRPRYLLCIGVPKDTTDEKLTKIFTKNIIIVN